MAETKKSSLPVSGVASNPPNPETERPPSPAAVPPKKFPRAGETAKRGPGRPPKVSVQRGGLSSEGSRASEIPAAAPAPYSAKADPGMPGASVRGLLQMAAGISAGISWAALKIPYMTALGIWQFSPAELDQIEKPGAPFLEKYAPLLDQWGIEIEFAGVLLPILTTKVFAILAAKRALEEQNKMRPATGEKNVRSIRQEPARTGSAAAAANAEPPHTAAASPAAATPPAPPDAFTHQAVDTAAELVSL